MFEIYGRNNCVWCDRAKELLARFSLPYTFFNIEEDRGALDMFKEHFPGAKTVPQIINQSGVWIGGYEDLYNWLYD